MKKAPSAFQVIKAAEFFTKMFSTWNNKQVVQGVLNLKEIVERFWGQANYRLSLERSDEGYRLMREGARLARKQLVEIAEGWVGSGRTTGQLIYELRTSPVWVEDCWKEDPQ